MVNKKEISEEVKEEYKERLKKIIAKKFDTTMIFPLSQFEVAFGELWGSGKPLDKLTDKERMMLMKWKEIRNNILNCGNQQKRNMFAEVDMHEVIWKRYQTVFYPKNSNIEMIEKENFNK